MIRWVERWHEWAVLAMLASGLAALWGSGALEGFTPVLAAAALVARALGWRVPREWTLLAAAVSAAVWPDRVTLAAADGLLALLTLEARSDRGYMLAKLAAFLEILAAAAATASAAFSIWLIIFLLAAAAALATAEIRRSARGRRVVERGALGRRLAALAVLSTAATLLLTACFFFVLPRTARAAIERFLPGARLAGFSNEINLGAGGTIQRSSAAVLHVRFEQGQVLENLRWRGTALGEFDGWRWYNSPQTPVVLRSSEGLFRLADDEQRRRPGRRFIAQVFTSGATGAALFVPGTPEFLDAPAPFLYVQPGGGLRVPSGGGMRYVVYGYLDTARDAPLVTRLSEAEWTHYLRLPPQDGRILELARTLTKGLTGDLAKARAIEQHLQTSYGYSLDAGEAAPLDPLAEFLFARRKGHCEFFASAMAVMLRQAWIPARVVTGFHGGTYNPVSGMVVIRGADAHSWVEAWLPQHGWTVFDPTPPSEAPLETGWRARLALLLDAADSFWREWVIGYDLDRQLTLASKMGESRHGLEWRGARRVWSGLQQGWAALRTGAQEHAQWFGGALAAALLALALAPWWRHALRMRRARRGEGTRAELAVYYERLLRLLKRRGLERGAAETPLEFARGVPLSCRPLVGEFTAVYNTLRFGGRRGGAERLEALLAEIARLPR